MVVEVKQNISAIDYLNSSTGVKVVKQFHVNVIFIFTKTEKQKLAAVMFNYFDRDFSGHVEKEEFWELQLLEHMDEISSLCTLLDIVTFDELGERDGKLSIDEFIQAFGENYFRLIGNMSFENANNIDRCIQVIKY